MTAKLYQNDPWATPIPLQKALDKCNLQSSFRRTPKRTEYTHPCHNSPRSPPASPVINSFRSNPFNINTKRPTTSQSVRQQPTQQANSPKRPYTADDRYSTLASERQRSLMLQVRTISNKQKCDVTLQLWPEKVII